MADAPPGRTPFIVHCNGCKHEWPLAYLPMNISAFSRVMKGAHCPACGQDSRTIMCGPVPPVRPLLAGGGSGHG